MDYVGASSLLNANAEAIRTFFAYLDENQTKLNELRWLVHDHLETNGRLTGHQTRKLWNNLTTATLSMAELGGSDPNRTLPLAIMYAPFFAHLLAQASRVEDPELETVLPPRYAELAHAANVVLQFTRDIYWRDREYSFDGVIPLPAEFVTYTPEPGPQPASPVSGPSVEEQMQNRPTDTRRSTP